MLIRSQNKKMIVNIDEISSLAIKNDYIRTHRCGNIWDTRYASTYVEMRDQSNTPYNIGVYYTKENGMKVFDMIQKHYEHSKFFQMPTDGEVDKIQN